MQLLLRGQENSFSITPDDFSIAYISRGKYGGKNNYKDITSFGDCSLAVLLLVAHVPTAQQLSLTPTQHPSKDGRAEMEFPALSVQYRDIFTKVWQRRNSP